ncbi:3-hydroxyacyl-CoA dehydrogenase NAD-binding domain-containing protein [Novosphingobium colocasiae]|uniref:3-hydroxybutyryl-CoA dehydrogenase n=1 Tax=Novosphingobium colocasiae TaxID=1256513 RepID=A0A918UEC3_9SPHN|nr:3-hydroxyacyl-CoA dehydrogenase NAD-binding domain-containing protein [Novosphingobium colocasiae]GGY95820.1 3-hydroxybutyryl-CoA dehydrogenase [Novosphingobium colocasiae]
MSGVIDNIAVCGAGAMGSGIAQVAAQAGATVKVFDVNAEALAASRKRTLADLDKLVARGKLSVEAGEAVAGRMAWVSSLDELAGCDLVVEAIIEDAGIKGQLFEKLEAVLAESAVIATNTSSLPVSRLARSLRHPGRFVGMHFFNPATAMKLVEVISGAATDPAVAARIVATAKHWGKVAIPAADVAGFIVNRVARPFYGEAFAALNEGAAEPVAIDALFKSAGFRMGPLELTDLIGQDVNFAVARSVFDSYFGRTRFVPQTRQAALVDAGWLGRKTGRGVYDYADGASDRSLPEAPVVAVSDTHRQAAEALKAGQGDQFVRCDGVAIGLTRGRTARSEARVQGVSVALLDWCPQDVQGAVGFAVSDEAAREPALAVLAASQRQGLELADRPGLIVARTLAQIANSGADAVLEKVADEAGIDAALRFGANYPYGPFAFADLFGRAGLVALLDGIADETGEALYRPSVYLRNTA